MHACSPVCFSRLSSPHWLSGCVRRRCSTSSPPSVSSRTISPAAPLGSGTRCDVILLASLKARIIFLGSLKARTIFLGSLKARFRKWHKVRHHFAGIIEGTLARVGHVALITHPSECDQYAMITHHQVAHHHLRCNTGAHRPSCRDVNYCATICMQGIGTSEQAHAHNLSQTHASGNTLLHAGRPSEALPKCASAHQGQPVPGEAYILQASARNLWGCLRATVHQILKP